MTFKGRITHTTEDGGIAIYVSPEDMKYVMVHANDIKKKKLDIEVNIKQWKPHRSLSQNNLLHLIINKIAKKTGNSEEGIKEVIKQTYGVYEAIQVPIVENGKKEFVKKLYLKSTANYNTKEMSDLIEGALYLATECEVEDINEEKREARNLNAQLNKGDQNGGS